MKFLNERIFLISSENNVLEFVIKLGKLHIYLTLEE